MLACQMLRLNDFMHYWMIMICHITSDSPSLLTSMIRPASQKTWTSWTELRATPVYLAEECQLVSITGLRWLHLSDIDMCLVHRTNRCFSDARSLLLDLDYGRVCQPNCESQTLHWDNFDEHSNASVSVFCVLCINWLTYIDSILLLHLVCFVLYSSAALHCCVCDKKNNWPV